jgi:hypothetical protein
VQRCGLSVVPPSTLSQVPAKRMCEWGCCLAIEGRWQRSFLLMAGGMRLADVREREAANE